MRNGKRDLFSIIDVVDRQLPIEYFLKLCELIIVDRMIRQQEIFDILLESIIELFRKSRQA
jgi:hypothetical protein